MSESRAEQLLKALLQALEDAAPPGAHVERNPDFAARVPAVGAIELRDGEPGTPAVTLSPLMYHYEHRAAVTIIVPGEDAATRDARFDTLRRAVGDAVAADRTLGGLCDWAEAEAPAPIPVQEEGGAALKGADIAVTLHYSTDDPLR